MSITAEDFAKRGSGSLNFSLCPKATAKALRRFADDFDAGGAFIDSVDLIQKASLEEFTKRELIIRFFAKPEE